MSSLQSTVHRLVLSVVPRPAKILHVAFSESSLMYLPRTAVSYIAKLGSANAPCRYGMLDPSNKDSNDLPLTIRAVFIIGPDKKLKLSLNYPASVGRNMEEIMRCVDALQLSAKHSVVSLPLCLPDDPIIPLLLPFPFPSLVSDSLLSVQLLFADSMRFRNYDLCCFAYKHLLLMNSPLLHCHRQNWYLLWNTAAKDAVYDF